MADIKNMDVEIKIEPLRGSSEIRATQEQKPSSEVIDRRAEGLAQELQKGVVIAKDGKVFSPPEILPLNDSRKWQLTSQLTPQLVELTYLISYWERGGRGDRAYLQRIQERIAKAKELQESGDIEGLFTWIQQGKYKFGGRPSEMAQKLEKAKWRLGGQKRRDEIIAEEVGFLEGRATEHQTRLGDVEQKISLSEDEKRVLETTQTLITRLEGEIRKVTDPESDIPDSFGELQQVKHEIERLTLETRDKKIAALSLEAAVKVLAKRVYERNAERNISFRKREEVSEMVSEVLKEELDSIGANSQASLKSFSELAELAKGKILSRTIKEAGTITEEYTALPSEEYGKERAKKVDTVIDQLSELATALGYDDIDVRRRFKRDKQRRVVGFYDESLSGVLKALAEQMEIGIDFREQGVRVYSSVEKALDTKLRVALTKKPLLTDQVIPQEARLLRSYQDPKTGELFGVGAYEAIASHFLDDKASPPEKTHFKLSRYEGQLLVVLEHDLNTQLSSLEIMDSELPRNKTTGEQEGWLNVRHLLLISKQTGRVFDVVSLLPEDYTLRYIPDSSTRSFRAEYGRYSKDFPDRFVQHADLTTPERIAALFHEVGHQIVTTNSDAKLAQEAQNLWSRSQFQVGGASGISKQEFIRTKKLLVANERGASARAVWLIRKLKRLGIDMGVGITEIGNFLNAALQNYERAYPQLYPECGIRFIRKV